MENAEEIVKKKIKPYRTHAELIRTCTGMVQMVIGCLTLLRVFGVI
jgi:hypothetical protein